MQLTRRESTLGCKPRISRGASNAVTNFIRMSDATPPRPQTSACVATDWLSACHAVCRPHVVTMTKPARSSGVVRLPEFMVSRGSASRLNWRASTGYGSNFLVDVTSREWGSPVGKRAIRHREAMLAPLKTLSGKRVNSFRPRFTANNRSRPLHKQAALEAQALACPFGRPLSNEAVRCVTLVGLDPRATSLVGLLCTCVRRSPSRLQFSSGVGVAICIPEEGGAGCTASLSAFASEDAPYDTSAAITGGSWPKLPTPLSGVRAATSVPDESGEGRMGSLAALAPRDVSFETLAVVCVEARSERSSLSTSPVAVCAHGRRSRERRGMIAIPRPTRSVGRSDSPDPQ
jgi:hypothetical protein